MKVETELARATARDLMQAKVVQLEADLAIERAIEILEENRISGAPVIDAGRLVGILSARDIARTEHIREGRLDGERHEYELADVGVPFDEEDYVPSTSDYSPRVLDGKTVRDWMNPSILSVDPDTTLGELGKKMVESRVHRLLVVEKDRLVGIVSAFDVVRFLAEKL